MMKKILCTILGAITLTTTATGAFSAEYRLGSENSQIMTVQNALENKGYEINDKSGFFGLKTLAAIIDFQDRTNIEISGTINEQTKRALLKDSDTGNSNEDLYWLSRIVHAESQGESFEGKLAVANCVLNRVKSTQYPNTVKEVIFDTKYGVQYQPTSNGTIYQTPDESSVKAAKEALSGVNPIGDCLFFFNPAIATNFWISENRQLYKIIGNHHFYL